MKKLLSAILVFSMLLALTACGGNSAPQSGGSSGRSAAATVTLKFAGTVAEDQPASQHMNAIKQYVEEKTEGRVKIDLYVANALGDAEVVIQGIMDGSVDMMLGFISGTYDPRFNITSFPVVLQNWDDVALQQNPDSNYTKILSAACAENNMVYLGTHVDGFCGVSSVKEPTNYNDPNKPKNCLIRCVTNEKSKMLLEAQGFQSIGLPWADTYTSIESGICDGSSGQSASGVYSNFRDVIKYYVPYNMTVDPMTYVINKDSLAKLSEGDQAILREAVLSEVNAAIADGPTRETAAFQQLKDYGITVLPLTEQEVATIHAKLWSVLEDVMVGLTSREIVDQVVADIPK